MESLLKISTWVWIAGVFVIIKVVFRYLAWLYYDKDKTLRENLDRAWAYLSQHSYFEIMKFALAKLHDRLSKIFKKRIRFIYLFFLFFLLNLVSLLLVTNLFSFNPSNLQSQLQGTDYLVHLFPNLSQSYLMVNVIDLRTLLVFIFQLSLLDLLSFILTIGITWVAYQSTNFFLFVLELMTDIFVLILFDYSIMQSYVVENKIILIMRQHQADRKAGFSIPVCRIFQN